MNAAQVICDARQHNVQIHVEGTDLVLEADAEPPQSLLEAVHHHKKGIIRHLKASNNWTAEDWRAFFDERAGIAEFDGGASRPNAEARAFECCVVEWLNLHPEPSDPGQCAWCGKSQVESSVVVPFGTKDLGHTWLHPECWDGWHRKRRAKAEEALTAMGLNRPLQEAAYDNAKAKFSEDPAHNRDG